MKIVETYIIWIKENGEFAKLYKCLCSLTYKWVVETRLDTYIVSKEFAILKNWIV